MAALGDALLCILLAPTCAACRQPLECPSDGAVCRGCWDTIPVIAPPFCQVCGDPLVAWRAPRDGRCPRCRVAGGPIGAMRAVGEYDGSLRAIVHALKYERRRSIAPILSARMRRDGRSVLADADMVVPVPLHWRKRWVRGFNQAEDLAGGVGLPIVRALRRIRATHTQTDLPAGERQANVRHAFSVIRGAPVAGRVVVLVDDVTTTGATLDACARVLIGAGAREVRALTAARVARQRHGAPPR